jgi:tRNA(Ser,Leu) C12 N-acetylase TAN1
MEKKILNEIDAIIMTYIPKHNSCRIIESKREFLRAKEKVEFMGKVNEKVNTATPLNIDIKTDWEIESPNMSVCQSCKETIYSPQYVLNVYVCGEKLDLNCPKIICQNCYNNNG